MAGERSGVRQTTNPRENSTHPVLKEIVVSEDFGVPFGRM